ncbi:GRIP and coiled-coil domain-containing protein [Nesidiocoris tenuis]|uniref:GRIP and coiled-coil domain-containing protein n=1 Tax=Nesidiocoris tenuis TaxID=355587 RepID=A0ABN7APY1_9HEMI|nr:GRIP and coiled-coil domain-containing protein [Nesidiocoris tenuis]
MEHLSKKELLDVVSKQQGDLGRYKARLTDLVSAHKTLIKEKELLESSLKSLSQRNAPKSNAPSPEKNQEKDDGEPDDQIEETESENVETLKAQLTTLMNSLSQLSEEKSRMEALFQADKKQIRLEKSQLENRVRELEQRLEHETRAHLAEMENFKSKLIIERHQREKEHNDHGVMIRELQKVVSEERIRRERAEVSLELTKNELSRTKEEMSQMVKETAEVTAQYEALKQKVNDTRQNSGVTNTKLQQELNSLKQQHMLLTMEEQEKIKEAEDKSKKLAAAHELRVANLEARLAELSETVGLYDRLRQSDQVAIEKLKDRLLQLEKEQGEEKSDGSSEDVVEKLRQIKKSVELASLSSEKPIDLKALVLEIFEDSNISSDVHKQCQDDLEQLKREFDQYRQKFYSLQQSPVQSLNSDGSRELEWKSQLKRYNERIANLHGHMEEMENSHKKEVESQKKGYMQQLEKLKQKLNEAESLRKKQVTNLETQLKKQRERVLLVVDEKNQELAELRESLSSMAPRRVSTDKVTEGDGVVLHYSEELARRDVELSRLRKEKLKIEAELRDIRREMAQLVAHEQHLTSLLQSQLQRFEQCQSREGANLEYLKNVVYNFLLSSDSNSKTHMLNAITAVLKFSDAEKAKIVQNSWWHSQK